MSQPNHTPGPVRVYSPFGRPEIVTDRLTAHETKSVVTQFGQPNADSNARLLAAAYNAFDSAAKRLGLNAVEMAERMQDGGIATLFREIEDIANCFSKEGSPGITRHPDVLTIVANLRAVIAKVKGGAA